MVGWMLAGSQCTCNGCRKDQPSGTAGRQLGPPNVQLWRWCVQVVGLSKLRTKYESHEAKRQLCNSYDLFAADERILPSLPKLLGAHAAGACKACHYGAPQHGHVVCWCIKAAPLASA